MKRFTATEVGQILAGHNERLYGRHGARIDRERDWIRHRYTRLCERVGKDGLRSMADAQDRAKAEWIAKHVIVDHAFLCLYSEGHGSGTVVGIYPTEKAAKAAGRGKGWYGGDCDVEQHRVGRPVVCGRGSRVVTDQPTPARAKRAGRGRT